MPFACIFVPDFPAEAVVRAEPELRAHAVVVVKGAPPLLTVAAANDGARALGIEAGMTNVQAAARLASNGVVRRRSLAQEAVAGAALSDCGRAFSPRVEQCAPDTVLLDLHGLERLFGPPTKMARELARRAYEVGLGANVAIAANLDAAICAARGFAGATVIPPGREAERLAPLSIEVLLQSAAQSEISNHKSTMLSADRALDLLKTLDRWGVRTFRALAALPEIAVSERLGPEGVHLQKLCRGQGSRTLAPSEAPLNFEEVIELEYPVEDLEALAFVLNRMIEQLCSRLSARTLSTNELRLRMELERLGEYDIEEHGSTRIGADQDARSKIQYSKLVLPVPMLETKTFLHLLQLELRAHPPAGPVAKLWLRAEPVQPRHSQGGLFLPTAPEPERLELTLARIASVVGEKKDPAQSAHAEPSERALRVGSAEILDTHCPDAFRMKRFAPPEANTAPARRKRIAAKQSPKALSGERSAARPSKTALRVFRPPVQIEIATENGRPTHMRTDSAQTDISGPIAWCAGPWRTSGEWWNEFWSRDEWDITVETQSTQALCRIYRDAIIGTWFLEGTYD